MNLITLSADGKQLRLKFRYDYLLIQQVKGIPGRWWDHINRQWVVPATKQHLEQVLALLPSAQIPEPDLVRLQGLAHDLSVHSPMKLNPVKPIANIQIDLPPGLKLYPFQLAGVEFIESRNGRALIGDEMGLGKTIQALTWMRIHPEARPAVIVVPASLKINWQREARKWLERENIQIISGSSATDFSDPYPQVIIINYDILTSWVSVLKRFKPQTVVIDESHYIKNARAKRTEATKFLADGVPHIIAMSGTPIINRPIEFYNAIRLIDRGLFPNWWKFATRFCGPKRNHFGVTYTGASNTEELHQRLTETIMIRRVKADVLSDLPPKVRSVVPLDIDNRAEYGEAVMDFIGWLERTEGEEAAQRAEPALALVAIGKLKQLAARGKLKAALGWIKDVLDQDEKLIVFCVHHWLVDAVMNEFKEIAVKLTGEEKQDARQYAVDAFQNDAGIRLFVGNIKAAGVGITLTAATNVAFLELGWTPGEHSQAEDRAHRIGQAGSVNIYYLVGVDTIEEDIADLLDRKREVLSQVLDGREAEKETILGELLRKLKEGRDD